LKPNGPFFLNIGTKPTIPSLPFEVALCLEIEFKLQNIIHWIKSIAISKKRGYPNIPGNIAVERFKPIVSKEFLSDCQEYIFHFTKRGNTKIDKLAIGVTVSRQNKYRKMEISKM
jgi:site-specific DNA-methyltransferase (adenine-specific)